MIKTQSFPKDKQLQRIVSFIKYPVISDKSSSFLEDNKYTFMVDKRANKIIIKKLIEFIFNVKVINVNTLVAPPKKRRVGKFTGKKAQHKKAIITLSSDSKITLFPNM
jgi:large subunit ribosomal protein L23|nr:ribosomal protein L23 [Meringosphaera mediterranea]